MYSTHVLSTVETQHACVRPVFHMYLDDIWPYPVVSGRIWSYRLCAEKGFVSGHICMYLTVFDALKYNMYLATEI